MPSDCSQTPGLGKFNGKTWGPYTAPSIFEPLIMKYVGEGIVKNQKTGTKWTGYRVAANGTTCPPTNPNHPFTPLLYRQLMHEIQWNQRTINLGYKSPYSPFTLVSTCNWLPLGPGQFSLTDWYSNVANNVDNWNGVATGFIYPGAGPASSLYKAYPLFDGPLTPLGDNLSPPTNNELADLIYVYVKQFWDGTFKRQAGPVFDKNASNTVDLENRMCPSLVLPTTTSVITTNSANPTNPPANNGSNVLDIRGNPILSRNQVFPLPNPVVKPTPSRNQAVPVSKPPARPTPTRNQAVPVPPKVR